MASKPVIWYFCDAFSLIESPSSMLELCLSAPSRRRWQSIRQRSWKGRRQSRIREQWRTKLNHSRRRRNHEKEKEKICQQSNQNFHNNIHKHDNYNLQNDPISVLFYRPADWQQHSDDHIKDALRCSNPRRVFHCLLFHGWYIDVRRQDFASWVQLHSLFGVAVCVFR